MRQTHKYHQTADVYFSAFRGQAILIPSFLIPVLALQKQQQQQHLINYSCCPVIVLLEGGLVSQSKTRCPSLRVLAIASL